MQSISFSVKLCCIMAAVNLKNVQRMIQHQKNIASGYIKEAQSWFPADNPFFHIVDLIKHLILLFYCHAFESNILNDDEQDTFIQLYIGELEMVLIEIILLKTCMIIKMYYYSFKLILVINLVDIQRLDG